MSFFNKVFGGKKEATMTASEVIQNLHETEKMLTKKQDFLEKKIETELDFARRNGAKNKKGNVRSDDDDDVTLFRGNSTKGLRLACRRFNL